MHSWAAMLLHLQTTDLYMYHHKCLTWGTCDEEVWALLLASDNVPQAWRPPSMRSPATKNNNNKLCQSDPSSNFAVARLSVWFVGLCSCVTVSLPVWLGFVVMWLSHAFVSVMSSIQWRLKICMQKSSACKLRAKTMWAKQCILSFLSRLSMQVARPWHCSCLPWYILYCDWSFLLLVNIHIATL